MACFFFCLFVFKMISSGQASLSATITSTAVQNRAVSQKCQHEIKWDSFYFHVPDFNVKVIHLNLNYFVNSRIMRCLSACVL